MAEPQPPSSPPPRDPRPPPAEAPDGGAAAEAGERPAAGRRATIGIATTVVLFLVVYLVVPRVAGLQDTLHRIRDGSTVWFGVAVVFEACSYAGYAWLVASLSTAGGIVLGLRQATQITLAATAATRLLAAGGAGGIAVTSWALSRAGHGAAGAARQVSAQLVAIYAVFLGTVVLVGLALALAGEPPLLSSLPAVLASGALALFTVAMQAPDALQRRLGSGGRWRRRLLAAPQALADGTRFAVALARRRERGLLGAALWWAFDIATLWACFWAFATHPPVAELVMAYFLGMLGNLLPLPGGIGGVEGGMVGVCAAFGIDAGVALVAVLAYRVISVWLPAVPGVLALVLLRRAAEPAGAPPRPR